MSLWPLSVCPLLASLPSILLLIGPALEQSPATQPKTAPPPAADLMAVSACMRHVQQVHPRPDRMNQFDAHLTPDSRVRVSGTEEETRLFWKCMRQRGVPDN